MSTLFFINLGSMFGSSKSSFSLIQDKLLKIKEGTSSTPMEILVGTVNGQ